MAKYILSVGVLFVCFLTTTGQDLSFKNESNDRIFDASLIFGNPEVGYEFETEKAQRLLFSGQIDSALNVASRLLQKAESGMLPPEQVVDAYETMGELLLKIGVQDLAQWYLEKAHDRYLNFHFKPSRYSAGMYSLLASNYITYYNMPEKALAYYKKSRAIYKNLDDYLFEASLTNNIGIVYLENDQLDSAQINFLLAKTLLREKEVPLDELMLSINNNLGEVAYRRGLFKESFDFFETNYQIVENSSDPEIQLEYRRVTSTLGKLQASLGMKKYDACIKLLAYAENNLESLRYNDQLNLRIKIQDYKMQLAKYAKNIDAYEEASQMKIVLIKKRQSIEVKAQRQATEQLVELQLTGFNIKLEAKQKELQLAKAEKRFNVFLILGLSILFLAITFFLMLVIRRRTRERNIQRELLAANLQHQKLKEEKL